MCMVWYLWRVWRSILSFNSYIFVAFAAVENRWFVVVLLYSVSKSLFVSVLG